MSAVFMPIPIPAAPVEAGGSDDPVNDWSAIFLSMIDRMRSLETSESIADLVDRSLVHCPGVRKVCLCLAGSIKPCCRDGAHRFALSCGDDDYGVLCVATTDDRDFARVQPVFKHVVNIIAAELEHRRLLGELIETRAQLERKVEARTRQLRGANDQLRRALTDARRASDAKSNFLANVSHELRTPLNAILGMSELMLSRDYAPLIAAKRSEYLRDIHSSGQLLLSLIDDLLDISRIEAGRRDLDVSEFATRILVRDVARLHRLSVRQRHVGLFFDVESITLNTDRRALMQILNNLLSNALKYTPPGGQVTVTGHGNRDGGYCFHVTDTGVGISAVHLDRIMKPFEQIGTTRISELSGSGLGLPIAHKLADLIGATLMVESRECEGTTVRVLMPPTCISPLDLSAPTAVGLV